MKKQQYKLGKYCKHSIVYTPVEDTPANPAIATSIYVAKAMLPTPPPETIWITLET